MRSSKKSKTKRTTYADSGVDIGQVKDAHKVLADQLSKSFKTRKGRVGEPVFPIGHYAGLVDLDGDRVLGLHVDSVGTKIIVAWMMKKYDTIGIDAVAMCANDLICTGLEPFAFLDYIATAKPDIKTIHEITKGLVAGAEDARMAIVGGETAVVPDLLSRDSGGLDLVGMATGIASKDRLVLGDKIEKNDVLVGVSSSGIHSNGLTLARKVLLRNHKIGDWIPALKRTIGEELLEPTRIYVKPVLELLEEVEIHGLAHVTGGGLAKLDRIVSQSKLGADLDQLPDPPTILEIIQKEGRVTEQEMYQTFNMGVGMVLITPETEVDEIIGRFEKYDMDAFLAGRVSRNPGIRVSGPRLKPMSLTS